jgi:hypothetical protein
LSTPSFAVALLQVRRQARVPEVDAVAAHRHTFSKQPRALRLALGQATVGSDDAVPGEIVDCGEDVADEARSVRIDVAVGADVALGDRADAFDDAQPP